jgi:hypothetical protein
VLIKNKNEYTFNPKTRYLTKGVQEELSEEIQYILWGFIDRLVNSGIPVDYLQVFELEFKGPTLTIKHFQEVPQYISIKEENMLNLENQAKQLKVYVIDDRDHSTMLLASEY